MMKTKLYLLIALSFYFTAAAQKTEPVSAENENAALSGNSSEQVNIDSLVAQQFAIAREKKWGVIEESVQQKAEVPLIKTTQEDNKESLPGSISILNSFDALSVKIGIILFAAFFASTFIAVRRLKMKMKSNRTGNKKNLKSNIQSIRLEKSVIKKDATLKAIRENLQNSSITIGAAEGSLTRKARELKIAKGELMLAAKIKSYELSICSNER